MGWYDVDHMSGWGWVGMTVSWILLLGLLVLAAVLLVRLGGRSRNESPAPAPAPWSAEQVLAERFARGEISAAEYREGTATLRATHPRSTWTRAGRTMTNIRKSRQKVEAEEPLAYYPEEASLMRFLQRYG